MSIKPSYPAEMLIAKDIVLRRHTIELAPLIFTLIDQERERLSEFLPWPSLMLRLDDERDYLKKAWLEWDQYRMFDYGIFHGLSNEFMGCIGAHTIAWDKACCELGYWLGSKFTGKGFATSSVTALAKELSKLGFVRVEIRCNVANSPSANVAQKSGFALDSIIKENNNKEVGLKTTMVWGFVTGNPRASE